MHHLWSWHNTLKTHITNPCLQETAVHSGECKRLDSHVKSYKGKKKCTAGTLCNIPKKKVFVSVEEKRKTLKMLKYPDYRE